MNNLFLRVLFLLFLLLSGKTMAATMLTTGNDPVREKALILSSTDSIKIKALLDRSSAFVNKKGEAKADLDQAINYGKQALALSRQHGSLLQKIAAYTILSQSYRENKDDTGGKKLAERAVALLPINSVSIEASDAFAELSTYYNAANPDSLVKKIDYFNRSVNILRKVAPKSLKLADRLKFLGDLKNATYDTGNAIVLLKESLALYKALGVKQLQDIYDLLGDALTSAGNTVEGLSYQLKALKTAEQYKDTTQMMSTIYYRLAFTYNAINQDNRTAQCMEKARYYALKNHNLNDWLLITGNLGTTYNKLRKYKDAVRICKEALLKCPPDDYQDQTTFITNLLYTAVATNSIETAKPYYDRLKALREAHHTELSISDAAMIEYLIATRRFEEVKPVINQFTELAKTTQSLISKEKIEHYLFQLDSAAGNYLSAIEHEKKAHALRDSLISRNYNKQIGRMQMTFDLQNKDKEIAFKAKHIGLLTHQNQLQRSALHNQKMVRNLIIATLVLLILLLGLGWNRYQLKQQANNILQEQQEEINTQNESLRQLLDEREWLIKEVHHRVKNNLQIVISLLNSQLANIKDVVALDVIRESQNRMRSISLIHQKLYQFDNLATIDASDYIGEIALYLQDSFDTFGKIRFTIQVEPVMMDVSQAVPIGLILNEAITNSIKYAFNNQVDKEVFVRLVSTAEEKIKLTVSDNGQGLPTDFDIKKSRSLGMQLMSGLSRQIRAELSVINKHGLTINVEWNKTGPYKKENN